MTYSGADGVYHLENMKTDTYKLQVKVDNVFFDEQEIRITPNTPQLPPIVPSRSVYTVICLFDVLRQFQNFFSQAVNLSI